jgi:hypothetical protein
MAGHHHVRSATRYPRRPLPASHRRRAQPITEPPRPCSLNASAQNPKNAPVVLQDPGHPESDHLRVYARVTETVTNRSYSALGISEADGFASLSVTSAGLGRSANTRLGGEGGLDAQRLRCADQVALRAEVDQMPISGRQDDAGHYPPGHRTNCVGCMRKARSPDPRRRSRAHWTPECSGHRHRQDRHPTAQGLTHLQESAACATT